MKPQLFNKYKDLIYQTSGIFLSENKEALLTARIGKRVRTLGLNDYGAYYDFVVADKTGNELSELLNAISTNVTHFFRESRHFEFLASAVRGASQNGANTIRVWCAASSTGEEPYSIAMTLLENMASPTRVEIIASDISTKVLHIAKFGVYRAQDIQGIRADLVKKYFQVGTGRAQSYFRAKSSLRNVVDFKQVNLSTPPFPIQGGLDYIFCRNVMIYFNDQLRTQLLQNFYSLLKPGGYLLLGLAESISGRFADFASVEPSVYQRA
jgi:chemotaxis protein methyltransferase CheR